MRSLTNSAVGRFRTATAILALTSCSALPELSEATGGIPVNDIVLRVKCELANAFEMKAADGKAYWLPDDERFKWMQDWTAQVDLTLEILDTSTFAPGGTLTEPFHNAYGTTAGPSSISTTGVPGTSISSISQNLTVAAGLSINGQASRTQTLSFNFSLAELHRWRARTEMDTTCAPSDNTDLRGRLGLKEWVAMVIDPIRGDDKNGQLLYAGYHPKPESASKPPDTGKAPNLQATGKAETDKQLEVLFERIQPQIQSQCSPADANIATRQKDAAESAIKASELEFSKLPDTETAGWNSALNARIDKVPTDLAESKKEAPADLNSLNNKLKDAVPFEGALEPSVKQSLHNDEVAAKKFNQDLAFRSNLAIKVAGYARADLANLPNAESAARGCIKSTDNLISRSQDYKSVCEYRDAIVAAKTATTNWIDTAKKFYDDAMYNIDAAESAVTSVKSLVKQISTITSGLQSIDPPISTFGQSVNFMLLTSANVTPTWNFAKFKGPNANLFSAGSTRTHTLSITVGAPTAGNPNAAISQNQLLFGINNSLKQNAIQ